MSDTVREYIGHSPYVSLLAVYAVLSTVYMMVLAAGYIDPVVSRMAETVFTAWASGFIACYAWMAHWLEGDER